MSKKNLAILIALSSFIRICFAFYYPLIGDELNFWNYYYQFPKFSVFWEFFLRYDTQQPLFYVLWFPIFHEALPKIALRLPSLIFGFASLYYWAKLFDWKEEKNIVPWVLFLFTPFLSIYSTFFLPYSLLVLASVANFHYFYKVKDELNVKNFAKFGISCLILFFVHYYGVLQAGLLCIYLAYIQKNKILKRSLWGFFVLLFIVLLYGSDFKNDFSTVHAYRKIPNLKDLFGYFNLLIGGRFVILILLIAFIKKKKWINYKSLECAFIVMVITISYMKTIMISPSMEARYLLILIYPLYYLTVGVEFKKITALLVVSCLASFYILQRAYGPNFVTDYSKIAKPQGVTGLMITPCPRFYFREQNFICKSDFERFNNLTDGVNQMLVSTAYIENFVYLQPFHQCKKLEQDLFFCTF